MATDVDASWPPELATTYFSHKFHIWASFLRGMKVDHAEIFVCLNLVSWVVLPRVLTSLHDLENNTCVHNHHTLAQLETRVLWQSSRFSELYKYENIIWMMNRGATNLWLGRVGGWTDKKIVMISVQSKNGVEYMAVFNNSNFWFSVKGFGFMKYSIVLLISYPSSKVHRNLMSHFKE